MYSRIARIPLLVSSPFLFTPFSTDATILPKSACVSGLLSVPFCLFAFSTFLLWVAPSLPQPFSKLFCLASDIVNLTAFVSGTGRTSGSAGAASSATSSATSVAASAGASVFSVAASVASEVASSAGASSVPVFVELADAFFFLPSSAFL